MRVTPWSEHTARRRRGDGLKLQQGSVTTTRLERGRMSSGGDHDPRANFIASESLSSSVLLSLCLFRHSTHFSSAVAAVALLFPSFRSFPLRLPGTEIESGPAAKFTMTLLPFARSSARSRCACSLPSPLFGGCLYYPACRTNLEVGCCRLN